ncbi:NAD(P)/FAD-dependent oxidoreductase [Aeromonas sanarellii]
MKFRYLPRHKEANGWAAILPERVPTPHLQEVVQGDWVVVGAGYAGLAFAHALAEHQSQARIVLLEAGVVGDNAAGRNSGFAIDLPHNIGSGTAELAKASLYRRLLKGGLAQLAHWVGRYRIDCDWQQSGKYHCAVKAGSAGLLKQYAHELDLLDEGYEYLEGAALSARLGTGFYHSDTPNAVLLNPAALVRGLADKLPDNVTLYERSPALRVDSEGGVRITTPHGEVVAGKAMFAVNGGAGQLTPFAGKLASLVTHATLTEPLTSKQRAGLGDIAPWGLTPVNAIVGATFRYTRDHRILIRQHVAHAPTLHSRAGTNEAMVRRHRQLLRSRFPELGEVAFAHSWSGLISVSRNGAPLWGQFGPDLYAALGCNGAGISKQTMAGKALADLVCGVESPWGEQMRALGMANYLPPRPWLDLGVQGYLWKERLLGAGEY